MGDVVEVEVGMNVAYIYPSYVEGLSDMMEGSKYYGLQHVTLHIRNHLRCEFLA